MGHRDLSSLDRRHLMRATAALAALGTFGPTLCGMAAAKALSPTGADAFAAEIAPGVFAHKGAVAIPSPENGGDTANIGFIIGQEAVAVVDTGGSAEVGKRLHEAIRAVTDKPIRYVINTHMHPDHVLGNGAFEADSAAFVAHHKMGRGLMARSERYLAVTAESIGEAAFAGTKIVLPTLAISEETTLDLGGRGVVLTPQPTAHTDNDLVVRDTETGTVFLGDLLFEQHIPTLDGSIRGWIAVLDALAKEPAARVVPGHGGPSLTWPDGAAPIRRYLDVITKEIRAMIAENRTLSEATTEVGLSEKDAWDLFPEYHARNVSAAFAELEWE